MVALFSSLLFGMVDTFTGVATLLIHSCTQQHDGMYTCRAANEAGVAEGGARLTVIGKVEIVFR
jgi:hypothetical protein